MLLPLLVALTLAEPTAASVDVPYLPQTEALCGGAAAAMVFRYWGERHADVQQFEPLVDRRAGGIATGVLADAVRQRGWRVSQLKGSTAGLREHLGKRQPLIVLLQDRSNRLHYVVAVGIAADSVYVHDPTWGPNRRVPLAKFLDAWKVSGYWSLVVLPGDPRPASETTSRDTPVEKDVLPSKPLQPTRCGRLLDAALDDIARDGLKIADAVLTNVQHQCPDAAGPLRELSGVRFSEGRWSAAEKLAAGALARDPADDYAWDVLASSRFMQDDLHGAIAGWNRIGRPRLDSVQIGGLTRTKYAHVAQVLGLAPNEIVTERGYRLAERRLRELPIRSQSRMGLRPEADGFAVVDVAIVESAGVPRTPMDWAAAGVRTAVTRELEASVPGPTGQGEIWEASWRWWRNRPRVAGAFVTPRAGRLPGVWRVGIQWDEQTYRAGLVSAREVRLGGEVSAANWLTPSLRLEIGTTIDSWDHSRRTVSIGGTLDQRFANDRLAVRGTGRVFVPVANGESGFQSTGLHASFRSSPEVRGWVQRIEAGVEAVTADAPFALWPGAGEGQTRARLARAHPLVDHGIVAGPVFGRRLGYVNADSERWFGRPTFVRLGIAGFIDVARAANRALGWDGQPLQVDAGVGARLRLPGSDGTLRIDYGRGLRDGAQAVTVAWQR